MIAVWRADHHLGDDERLHRTGHLRSDAVTTGRDGALWWVARLVPTPRSHHDCGSGLFGLGHASKRSPPSRAARMDGMRGRVSRASPRVPQLSVGGSCSRASWPRTSAYSFGMMAATASVMETAPVERVVWHLPSQRSTREAGWPLMEFLLLQVLFMPACCPRGSSGCHLSLSSTTKWVCSDSERAASHEQL